MKRVVHVGFSLLPCHNHIAFRFVLAPMSWTTPSTDVNNNLTPINASMVIYFLATTRAQKKNTATRQNEIQRTETQTRIKWKECDENMNKNRINV